MRQINKVINNAKSFLFTEDIDQDYKRNKEHVQLFIDTGQTEFSYQEYAAYIDKICDRNSTIRDELVYINASKFCNSVVAFHNNASTNTFVSLIDAYYWDLLTSAVSPPEHDTMYLPSDISSLYIYILTFYPELINKFEPVMIAWLEFNKTSIRTTKVRKIKFGKEESYGRDCILYLAAFIAESYNRSDSTINFLRSECYEVIEPSYLNTIDNIFSDDPEKVKACINDMAEFHITSSNCNDYTCAFHTEYWIYFPVEIFALLVLRDNKGLDNSFISHPLIDKFLPFYLNKFEVCDDSQPFSQRVLFSLNIAS